MSMFDKAKDLAGEHSDTVEEHSDRGLDQAGEFAEGKGVGTEHVDSGRDLLDDRIGDGSEEPPA
ncbi:antitoxin [Rothia sp. ARF10]|nr:antitoxin [Rothia sp. ARF10]